MQNRVFFLRLLPISTNSFLRVLLDIVFIIGHHNTAHATRHVGLFHIVIAFRHAYGII